MNLNIVTNLHLIKLAPVDSFIHDYISKKHLIHCRTFILLTDNKKNA